MKNALTPKQNAYLKKLGMGIKPSLVIGKGGLSDNSLDLIDKALKAHELIKAKALNLEKEELLELGENIARASSSILVEIRGTTLLFYRRKEKDPIIKFD